MRAREELKITNEDAPIYTLHCLGRMLITIILFRNCVIFDLELPGSDLESMNSLSVEWVLENNQVIVLTNSVKEVNGANSLVEFIAVVVSL